jgi:predicted phage terminase large subunit-like protein
LLSNNEIIELKILYRWKAVERGKSNFWIFCKLKSPSYFTENKPYLKDLVLTLQNFYEGKLLKPDSSPYRKIIINIPPRLGKSRSLVNLCQWILGKDQNERVIECSYNDDTAGDFSKYTRDGIQEETIDEEAFIFSDFFPDVKLKYGTSSYSKWALEGQHFNYMGAGIGGSITGKGGSILIIDDPVKNEEEAFNEDRLEKIWQWYTGTFLSRGDTETRKNPLEIIVMSRWSDKDLCGRILDSEEAGDWLQVKMKAYNEETDTMLCEAALSKDRYLQLQRKMVPQVFWANYLQETIEAKGLLYKTFKTYDKLPADERGGLLFDEINNYTDTADEGDDFLCSINYGVYGNEAYILDVLYTKDGMEITEPATAKFLFEGKVNRAYIESNNGGRGFARNVKRILEDEYRSIRTSVRWFHQSNNKRARIMSNSSFVQDHIYFPVNWNDKFPEYFKAMTTYMKEGRNRHDDAPDTTTGIAEKVNRECGFYQMSKRLA